MADNGNGNGGGWWTFLLGLGVGVVGTRVVSRALAGSTVGRAGQREDDELAELERELADLEREG